MKKKPLLPGICIVILIAIASTLNFIFWPRPQQQQIHPGYLPISVLDTHNRLQMVSDSAGWALADAGIWRTTDSGAHWSQVFIFETVGFGVPLLQLHEFLSPNVVTFTIQQTRLVHLPSIIQVMGTNLANFSNGRQRYWLSSFYRWQNLSIASDLSGT